MKHLKRNESLADQYKDWKSDQRGDLTESIKIVLDQIMENMTSGWKGSELQASYECVALGDVEHGEDEETGEGEEIVYNGWYENLSKFAFDERIKNILGKIDANNEDMWTHDLEDTFSCVIVEDIDLEDEDEPYTHDYNGWYEDLQEIAGITEE